MSDRALLARRAKPVAVVVLLAAGALVLLGTTQTWLSLAVAQTHGELEVAGSEAALLAQPLAIAVLALSLVLTLVGRVLRYVLGAVATAAGVGIFAAVLPVVTGPPVSSYAATVTESTGLAGEEAISALVSAVTATGWPLTTLIASVVIVLGGAFVLVTAHAWQRGGRRFDATHAKPSSGPVDPIDSWDELSHGEDPTR